MRSLPRLHGAYLPAILARGPPPPAQDSLWADREFYSVAQKPLGAFDLIVGALLAFCLALSGCIGPIAASNLTVEQIQAMKDTNGDLFICLSGVGPPGNAGITVLLLPKGTKPDIIFTPNCQIQSGKIQ